MPKQRAVWPGRRFPLGASWDGEGVNFSIFSENAEQVELCLFDPDGRRELERIPMRFQTEYIWHSYLPEARAGQVYAYRVGGPYEPTRGMRFNRNKLLLDPYAKQLVGQIHWHDALFGYRINSTRQDLTLDRRDSAFSMPKCRVVDTAFSWGDDRRPNTSWQDTVIYELHVKGYTRLHPDVPEPLRGTYNGLASYPVIEHLKRLGVTAVELMPVHAFVDDRHLVEKGLRNYWGYNSIGFFAPDMRYCASEDISEFRTMVKRFHSAGIEVILDVVYNHTAEGNHLGPTLSFRGIDNASYYRLVPEQPRYYMDFTGCGNTLNLVQPRVLQLIMDSLRYWATEMHIDGFRFDLAAALARELFDVNRLSAFFEVVSQDPVLSQVKLIAEPWDLGAGGYQVGNFPPGWAEWNGKYRDSVRAYWKGDGGVLGELGYRLTGSSDLYQHNGRRPCASVNFVTAHDGFTLKDLVTYNDKHNEANLENNQDGESNNRSWNCGAEGPTDDARINALRGQQMRNFLATLLLSQGVPMLLGGDEMGRTQIGNNNSYAQDNELNWVNWNLTPGDEELLRFTQSLLELRRNHPTFRRRKFFQGRPIKGAGVQDITWLNASGREMTDEEWDQSFARCLGLWLAGDALFDFDDHGKPLVDDDFILLLNAHHEMIEFTLPRATRLLKWQVEIDTSVDGRRTNDQPRFMPGSHVALNGRSLILLRSTQLQSNHADESQADDMIKASSVVLPKGYDQPH